MNPLIKKTLEHSSFFTAIAFAVSIVGVEPIKAYAQEVVTVEVSKRVDDLEQKIEESEVKRQEDSDEIKDLLIKMMMERGN